jgi:hypothetical protein
MRHVTKRNTALLAGIACSFLPLGVTDASSDGPGAATPSAPDRIAEYAGGTAARLYVDGRDPVPGEIYLLLAHHNGQAARSYEATPLRHRNGVHHDTFESNLAAVDVVEGITGEHVERLDLTSAPAGGPSGGLPYALAYLDLGSDGAFTDGLRIAASGTIRGDGYVGPVTGIDEKTAAAAFVDVAVLFTASVPDRATIDTHGARFVGEMEWVPSPGTSLAEQRHWDRYERWGRERPQGMDVVAVRHLGDVAAYLCGTGSTNACEVVEELALRPDAATTGSDAATTEPAERSAAARTGVPADRLAAAGGSGAATTGVSADRVAAGSSGG